MTYRFDTNTTIYFKGNLTCDGSEGIGSFSFSDSVNLSGNCMALLFMDDAANQFSLKGYNNVFDSLFYDTLVNNVSKTFLPATTLSDACYRYMFSECYYLNKIPDLPATTLKPDCYFGMFRNSSIIDPPTVPSTTTWADYACSNMFAGCSSLMTIASFNYAKLAAHCCEYMYSDCTALVTVKLTKMTQTKSHCCQYMFSNCTRLTSCYLYNHSSVAEYAYQGMFYKCSKLVTADVDISVSTLNSYALNSMFTECKNLTSIGKYEFTSVANSFKSPLSFMFYGCTSLTSIPKDAGFGFSCSGSLQYDNDLCRSMFYGCTKLSSVTCKIPFIDSNIFTNCKSLTSFTTTASIRSDGEGGFENCTSLTSLPTPFATGTQAFHGYMFRGCTALRNASGIQKLIATCSILSQTSWYNFTNCTSLIKGPLTIGPNTSGSYNYSGGVKMFSGCTSLTQSPEILDGTVGSGSGNQQTFSGTFENCSSLKYIKCLISNPQSDYNGRFLGWVDGVPSTGIFIKAPGAEWTTGRSGIPEGWVVVDDGTVETVEIYRSYAECPHHRIVFESGMTWREWINSKYNVFGYKITSTGGIECEYKIPNISDSSFWLDEDPDSIISAVAKYIEYGAP